MDKVRAKKTLGQHFLKDETIARKIAFSLTEKTSVLEIGPGMGVLTRYLLDNPSVQRLKVVEIDRESVDYLREHYPILGKDLISEDFLKMNLDTLFDSPFAIMGNFPYNISNQILFRLFENRNKVTQLVGMFQKEVAERVCSQSGSRTYGILSVLLSAFYDAEYLFPKVKSAVIRLVRNGVRALDCDEDLFVRVVKTAFNQRRKMIRSSLKPIMADTAIIEENLSSKRAEQLSVEQFVHITKMISNV